MDEFEIRLALGKLEEQMADLKREVLRLVAIAVSGGVLVAIITTLLLVHWLKL